MESRAILKFTNGLFTNKLTYVIKLFNFSFDKLPHLQFLNGRVELARKVYQIKIKNNMFVSDLIN